MCEAYRQQIKQTTKQNISKKPDEEGFSSFKLVTVWWKRREIQETITIEVLRTSVRYIHAA